MKLMRWLLASQARFLGVTAGVLFTVILVSTVVVAVKVSTGVAAVQERVAAGTTGSPSPSSSTAPAPVIDMGGDPVGPAVGAVERWATGDIGGLAVVAMPGLVGELAEAPAPDGLEVTGPGAVTTPGVTLCVVTVPTTEGDVLVELVPGGQRGLWMAQSLLLEG